LNSQLTEQQLVAHRYLYNLERFRAGEVTESVWDFNDWYIVWPWLRAWLFLVGGIYLMVYWPRQEIDRSVINGCTDVWGALIECKPGL
jgi:hypothetical protein